MSLDLNKLENLTHKEGKLTARCPACAQSGGDEKGEHLVVYPDERFGCVVYPGHDSDAAAHRREIFQIVGDPNSRPVLEILPRQPSYVPRGIVLKADIFGQVGRFKPLPPSEENEPILTKEPDNISPSEVSASEPPLY